jgi:hypothetical protein
MVIEDVLGVNIGHKRLQIDGTIHNGLRKIYSRVVFLPARMFIAFKIRILLQLKHARDRGEFSKREFFSKARKNQKMIQELFKRHIINRGK